MVVKETRLVPITAKESEEFLQYLKMANENMIKAAEVISNKDFPYVNIHVIAKLRKSVAELQQLGCLAANGKLELIKVEVVEMPESLYCYQLAFFKGRNNMGVIGVETNINRENYVDDDAFLAALVNAGVLTAEDANTVTGIELLSS